MWGRKRSPVVKSLLRVLSAGYGAALFLRRMLYALRIARTKKLPCKVISVGNLTLGGTGKTPAVIHIAEFLLRNKRRPVVMSRGYGRKNESAITVVSDGMSVLVDTATGGDEPVLIGSRLTGMPVVAGSDRYEAGTFAIQSFNPDTVILDDGFQHVRLRRDLDIVLVDAVEPFGNGELFPSGLLREPLSSLRRAHMVLITRADRSDDVEALKAAIGRKTRAQVFTSQHAPVDIADTKTGERRPLSALKGTTVFAFSGIARPGSFTSLLRSLGADIKGEKVYPDHYVYRKSDLAEIFQKAVDSKAAMVITTEKDAMRLKTFNQDGIWSLRIELRINENKEWEEALLQRL